MLLLEIWIPYIGLEPVFQWADANYNTGAKEAVSGLQSTIKAAGLVIAGIAGVIGSVKVYFKFQKGEDVTNQVMIWGGSIIVVLLISQLSSIFS